MCVVFHFNPRFGKKKTIVNARYESGSFWKEYGRRSNAVKLDVMFRLELSFSGGKVLMILYQVKENAKWRRICTSEYNIPDSLACKSDLDLVVPTKAWGSERESVTVHRVFAKECAMSSAIPSAMASAVPPVMPPANEKKRKRK